MTFEVKGASSGPANHHFMLRRSGGFAVLSGLMACAVIAATVSLGLRVPGEARLASFPPGSVLDYDASFRSGLAPLRESYVRGVLGDAPKTPAASGRGVLPSLGDALLDPFALPRVEDAHPFVNDDMADARSIAAVPFTGRTVTAQATREPGEPRECSSEGGTAWYRYRSPVDEELVANTFGSGYALRLGVYEAPASGPPKLVEDCDSDLTGNALVQFPARRGVTYLFQVTEQTTGGRLVFNLEPGGVTELVSASPTGEPGSGQSQFPSISADGRYVAFESHAKNLVPESGDRRCFGWRGPIIEALDRRTEQYQPCFRVYLADRATGTIRLASVSSTGEAANNVSQGAALSGDGRAVAFYSHATNLDPRDTGGDDDVFVHDLTTGTTELISVASPALLDPGAVTEESVGRPSISDDGRYVAFAARVGNLVPGDTNGAWDIFVRDRTTDVTERVSVTSDEQQAEPLQADINGSMTSWGSAISSDGRYVAFVSRARLHAADTNGWDDVYLRDRLMGTTEIVSVSSHGETGDNHAEDRPSLSADGRYVVFGSLASNLVDGDENELGDVFVRDRLRGVTFRASVSSTGEEAHADSWAGTISGNGRYVTFSSIAGLAPGSRSVQEGRSCNVQYLAPACPDDLYVYDILTATTTRVPVAPGGDQLQASARDPSISADGSVIAFYSGCVDCPGFAHVWVHDRYRRNT